MRIDYDISDIRPFINWIYFDYAWSMNGKDNEERDRLHADANAMLDRWQGSYHTHAVFRIVDANSDGDDIIADGVRLPMLRQQKPTEPGRPNLCLADFIRPASKGIKDRIGVFAATVSPRISSIWPVWRAISAIAPFRLPRLPAYGSLCPPRQSSMAWR